MVKKPLIALIVGMMFLGIAQSVFADNGFGVTIPNPLCVNNGELLCQQEPRCNGNGYSVNFPNEGYAGVTDCCLVETGGTDPVQAPCISDFPSLIAQITRYVSGIVTSIAVVIFLYAGFLYLTSAGNPEKISRGNKAVIYGVIGIAVALAASGLATVIKTVITGSP